MGNFKRNFIYNSIYQILAILIPLVTTPYLTRTLGAKGLGEYSYAFSVAYYFYIIIKLGLDNYGNREIAAVRHDKDKLVEVFSGIYGCQLMCAALSIFAYIVICLLYPDGNNLLLVMLLYIVSGALDITWFFWGLEEFKITVTRNIVIKLLTTILIFILVRDENSTLIYAVLISSSCLMSQILIWPFLRKYVDKITFKKSNIIKHFKPNLILFVPIVAVSIYKTMAKILLASLANTVEVGYYDSSEKIIQIPLALITSLGTVMLPKMSNLYAKGSKDEAQGIFGKSIELVMFLSTSMGFGIMAVAKTFVPWFYGEGFEECIILFQILLPSCMFLAFANVIRTQYLVPHKEDKKFIASLLTGAVVNVITNLLLIPEHGAKGAAVGTLIAEVSVCVMQIIFVYRQLPIGDCILKSIPFVLSGICMYVVLVQIDFVSFNPLLNLICQIGIGVIIYLFCLLVIFSIKKVFVKK